MTMTMYNLRHFTLAAHGDAFDDENEKETKDGAELC